MLLQRRRCRSIYASGQDSHLHAGRRTQLKPKSLLKHIASPQTGTPCSTVPSLNIIAHIKSKLGKPCHHLLLLFFPPISFSLLALFTLGEKYLTAGIFPPHSQMSFSGFRCNFFEDPRLYLIKNTAGPVHLYLVFTLQRRANTGWRSGYQFITHNAPASLFYTGLTASITLI